VLADLRRRVREGMAEVLAGVVHLPIGGDLGAQVAASEIWAADVREADAQMWARMHESHAAAGDREPAQMFLSLTLLLEVEFAFYRAYLLSRFGFEWFSLDYDQVPDRPPLSAAGSQGLGWALFQLLCTSLCLETASRALQEPAPATVKTLARALRRMETDVQEARARYQLAMLRMPQEVIKQGAAVSLSADISIRTPMEREGVPTRVARSLAEGQTGVRRDELKRRLRERLPTAVVMAAEGTSPIPVFPADVGTSLQSRSQRIVAGEGPEIGRLGSVRVERLDGLGEIPADESLEDFALAEMAYRELLRITPLSAREREVVALREEDVSQVEIADRLGCNPSTVRVTARNARRKLEQTRDAFTA
jgi:RNA polymerase sigma factor (sigma-70 family)